MQGSVEKTGRSRQEVNSFLGMVLQSIMWLFWGLQRPKNFKTYPDLFQLDSSVTLNFLSGLKVHSLGFCTKKLQDQSLLDTSLDVPEHKHAGAELFPLHPTISSQGWRITTLLFGLTAHQLHLTSTGKKVWASYQQVGTQVVVMGSLPISKSSAGGRVREHSRSKSGGFPFRTSSFVPTNLGIFRPVCFVWHL